MIKVKENNSVYIPSIDGKDLYLSNNYVHDNKNGYALKNKSGEFNLNKFINTADYSLDLMKLREIYFKIYRNRNFSFWHIGKEFTSRIINVTFKYSVKKFNRIRKGIYIKNGFKLGEVDAEDCLGVLGGEIVLVQTDTDLENPVTDIEDIIPYFYYDNEANCYKAKTNIPSEKSVADIRSELYNNGFICEGVKYIRYKRSSGASRVGKCLFIDEKLYRQMHQWEMCGFNLRKGAKVDLASLEPNIALTLSSIIDTIDIQPENILVIDDYDSEFKELVAATELIDGRLQTSPKTVTIKNSIWDGQSLLDSSKFGKYSKYGMLLLRNRFFKSCCINTNIQQWFKDNNITKVSQLKGFTYAKDISEIKMITTPNSIKFLKFGKLEDWLLSIDTTFGIVKHEKATKFFKGEMVQTHYQLLNTLQLSQEETKKFLNPSLEYYDLLKNDPDFLRFHIKYNHQNEELFGDDKLETKNDIVYKLLGLNSNFYKTKMYHQFKLDLLKSYKKEMRKGHILVNGNYSTLCGNPLEMLKASIGLFDGTSSIKKGHVHSLRFDQNKKILCSRSPHVNSGNILIVENDIIEDILIYFNLSPEMVAVNSIKESLLDRLSGCDFDSDTMLMTDNAILLLAAMRNYDKFLVPVKLVEAKKCDRKYTNQDKCDLDIKTSVNKIGEIINLSQEINSKMWDKLSKGASYDEVMEMYYDSCQLDVMSNLEIDSAKRENPADNVMELKLLKNKYCDRDEDGRYIRPMFFKYIDKDKGYGNLDKKAYKYHNTTMDFVQKIINSHSYTRSNTKEFARFKDILKPISDYEGRVNYKQIQQVVSKVRKTYSEIKKIYNVSQGYHLDQDEVKVNRYELTNFLKEECCLYISKLELSEKTMCYLISIIDSEQCKDISKPIFNMLFATANQSFYKVINDSKQQLSVVKEDEHNGIYQIFGKKYSKFFA